MVKVDVTAPAATDQVAAMLAPARRRIVPQWLRLLLSNPLAALGCVLLLLIVAGVVFAPLLTPYAPDAITDATGLAPSAAHWFGTDDGGRDVLARVLYGGRLPLLVGLDR